MLQIGSYQLLRAPVSPHCWAAIWTPSSVLQKRIKQENDLRLLWFSVHTPEAIMCMSDLLHPELAEVRVTEAALVGQQLSPPLHTPQGVIPGGH